MKLTKEAAYLLFDHAKVELCKDYLTMSDYNMWANKNQKPNANIIKYVFGLKWTEINKIQSPAPKTNLFMSKKQFLERLFTQGEAIEYLNISRDKFMRLCKKHSISPCKEIGLYAKTIKLYWLEDLDYIKHQVSNTVQERKEIDILGQKFGRLTVVEESKPRSRKRHFLCRCDCGVDKKIAYDSLKYNHTRSCGCLQKELVTKDLLNKRFGMLVVLEKCEQRKNNNIYWLCKCDCGNYKEIKGSHLNVGSTKSCGCQRGRKKK
ncbi:hypothetical protein JCM19045_4277 [Bacillus sp. JCM 19045]|nr:hypothetical protein JCM19045_4277 [Bacillus sp. JCM 19045]